MVLITKIRVIT